MYAIWRIYLWADYSTDDTMRCEKQNWMAFEDAEKDLRTNNQIFSQPTIFYVVFSVAHFSRVYADDAFACVLHITSILRIMIYLYEENGKHRINTDERKSGMQTLSPTHRWFVIGIFFHEVTISKSIHTRTHTLTDRWTRIYTHTMDWLCNSMEKKGRKEKKFFSIKGQHWPIS